MCGDGAVRKWRVSFSVKWLEERKGTGESASREDNNQNINIDKSK